MWCLLVCRNSHHEHQNHMLPEFILFRPHVLHRIVYFMFVVSLTVRRSDEWKREGENTGNCRMNCKWVNTNCSSYGAGKSYEKTLSSLDSSWRSRHRSCYSSYCLSFIATQYIFNFFVNWLEWDGSVSFSYNKRSFSRFSISKLYSCESLNRKSGQVWQRRRCRECLN